MQDGYVTAGFNALNQPTAIWSKIYQNTSNWMYFGYDPLGRCVKRWVSNSFNNSTGATFFFYDGWNLIQEGPNAAAADRLYVHGARVDEIVATQVDGTWYYNHYDAQGNCILQSMANGGIQAQFDYDAFGFPYFYNAIGGKGTPKTRFLFTGREYLSDLRLYDYRNRMYQPELGRFLQPDPKQFEAGDYNLYRYCHNDPVNRADPTGLDTAIQIGMGTNDNPLGHVAVATTGQGVRSFGTDSRVGPNFSAYLASQAGYRNSVVYVIPTTKDQENRIQESLNGRKGDLPNVKKDPVAASKDNCSTRSSEALEAGDVKVGNNSLPAELQRKLDNMVSKGEATKYNVPKDSKPNEVWKLFDKKP
jgi:RHS repeat-associated protein